MAIQRNLVHIDTPQDHPGFLGQGHVARPVIQRSFAESDPFIMLMDDMLDKKDNTPSGGPHPHAGFETVSLLIEGEMGEMKGGDFQMMTAGSGIVHTETIDRPTKMRLLQLWLNLPKKNRWAPPRLQDLPLEHVPHLSENGLDIKLYSGELAGLVSPIQNYTPMILADIRLQPGVTTIHQLPANFNTFLYVLDGSAMVGQGKTLLSTGSVGWLDIFNSDNTSELKMEGGHNGVHVVLYAGKPTGDAIVSHGPFIGGSNEDILRLYNEYRQGKMKHISTVEEEQKRV
ncbi:MAG TPA: pirin-like C-terminal cupin domain-containing protein [Flavisolibacter sp.]|jgi:redox-sensitive bicupin YhaK (pirin superfamily)|nr:pirin-like C-terminal cupin domain-containing protein [Flavisolibacter sp.]